MRYLLLLGVVLVAAGAAWGSTHLLQRPAPQAAATAVAAANPPIAVDVYPLVPEAFEVQVPATGTLLARESVEIVSELARIRYRTAGDFTAGVVVRAPSGGGIRGGQTHSQSPEAIFAHICGVKTVIPSNPYDAKGLLIAAIEDDDPIIFFEPKRIYNGPFDGDPNKPAVPWSTHAKGDVPEGYYTVPIGKCDIVREGTQVTIVTYGTMVHVCEAAAKKLGLDAEIIDVRTMSPLDLDPICSSVKKTGRCVIAHEATRFCGFGAELSASIQEECFWYLEAPIQRVAGWDTPYPHAFEWEYFPGQARVALALRAAMGEQQ